MTITMTKLSESMDTAEVADHLGVHPATIRNWAIRGDLPLHHIPIHGNRRCPRTHWNRLLRKAAVPVQPKSL